MAPRLWIDKSRAALYDETSPGRYYEPGTLPAAVADPTNNLSRVFWHSGLNYLETFYDRTITLALPSRGAPPGSRVIALPDHNAGAMPYGVLLIGGAQVPTGHPLQGVREATRQLVLVLSANDAWLRESWTYDTVPALNVTARVILFRSSAPSNALLDVLVSETRVYFGKGKFDTNRDYLKRADTGADFYMTNGRTILTNKGGVRSMLPNGASVTFGANPPAASSVGFFGVKS